MDYHRLIVAISLLVPSISAVVLRRDEVSYGNCTNPTIKWSEDDGFYPANTADFDHEPTDDIEPIFDFICSTLENKCRAPLSTGIICLGAKTEAKFSGLEGHGQGQADAFNDYILHEKSSVPSPSSTSTPDPPKPTTSNTANVTIGFSAAQVKINDHIDPKWWFDNKIKLFGQGPVVCAEESERMYTNASLTTVSLISSPLARHAGRSLAQFRV
jgi:hypothetical protein